MIHLSICIATLNRADYIGATLDSILPQMTSEIELVIVDGASTDNTEAVVRERIANRENCRYRRLDQKGGIDADYCKAVAEATGTFCWLMTDDDLMVPDAIATVLRELDRDPDLVVVNADVYDRDFSRLLVGRKMKLDADRDFTDAGELMRVCGDLLTFIGAVVIRREVWNSRDPKPYFGTEFVHVGVIFQKPLDRPAHAIARPLIKIRYGNAQWTARGFQIWMFKWPKLVWSFALPEDAKRAVVVPEPWRSPVSLVSMKARGSYTYETYRTQLRELPMGFVSRLLAIAIAAFPDTLFNALMSLVVAPVLLRSTNTWYELRTSRFNFRRRWFGFSGK